MSEAFDELAELTSEELIRRRVEKFGAMGEFVELGK